MVFCHALAYNLNTHYFLGDKMKNPIPLDTLVIAEEAKLHQERDDDVVNATIGSIIDEHHQFHAFDTVLESISNLNHLYPYTKPEGMLSIGEKWFEHLTKGHLDVPKRHIMTLGGTGALYVLFKSMATSKDIVINAIPTWNNNYQMLAHQHITYETFNMFHEALEFDVETLKHKIIDALNQYEQVFVLLNDPSHNPSGYSMSEASWITILNFVHELNLPERVYIINDMAYVDYADRTYDFYEVINQYLGHTTIFLTYSGSKTFSLYGARVGMLVGISHHQSVLEKMFTSATSIARSTYSLPSSFGFKAIEKVFDDHYDTYIQELQETKALLSKRATQFINILNDKKIQYLPYHHGFFVTVVSHQPLNTYEHLKTHKIYTVPVEHGIRFAISSLTLKDINRLKDVLNRDMFK
jgi:aspartate/tyrosine/aromatic aminotransferase